MQITDVITAPWAILSEKLLEIQAVYASHVRGKKIDIATVEARLGERLDNDPQGYQINSGVAVIPVAGVIAKKMNLMSQISGGASSQLIARDIKAALADPNVKSILLHIDSPGGTVDGTETLAELVRAASEQKPVIAFADGMMASAAYWIASAANEIVASSNEQILTEKDSNSLSHRIENVVAELRKMNATLAEVAKKTKDTADTLDNATNGNLALKTRT